jgi:uncharacterized protein DUF3592
MTPVRAGTLVGLGAFVFFAGAMNTSEHGWFAWYQLAGRGQHAEARVTARRPEVHETCDFTFSTGSEVRTASVSGCDTAVGDVVRITYLPSDPSFVTISDPKEELAGQIVGSLGMSAIAGLVTGVRVRWQRRKEA